MTTKNCNANARIEQVKKLENKLELYNKLILQTDKAPKYRAHLEKERDELQRQYEALTGESVPGEGQ